MRRKCVAAQQRKKSPSLSEKFDKNGVLGRAQHRVFPEVVFLSFRNCGETVELRAILGILTRQDGATRNIGKIHFS